VQVEGTWNACNLSYCLGSTALDLGRPGQQADRADADFDGDGTAEPNRDEFEGLVGKTVSLRVERNLGGFVVYVINGHGFRNADGSFARAATQAAASATVAP
jgi:hypothetical protein